ncbi:dicarboxylate transporter/tellurite-resistance protein TehA [Duganella vulcania]|uniref:Dicarboxylate transporter/tellurite-resistance protein TehA n=1 Tax=Duganella vulcania TaxID=2692166 RepID=A0A845GS74_9BURK|nr:dicarboxylate transporter/tellurite-resistance protein TehA [Duganella vulcania]MYM95527.1 dicarboxylate transporter/tellurite-resistance protein TehA [Duganella vulcania]
MPNPVSESIDRLAGVPVAFFGMAVGVLALSQAWLVAGRLWPDMAHPSHWLGAAGLLIWAVLLLAYLCKWWARRDAALAELYDPVISSLATLGPISTMLASVALLAWSRPAGLALWAAALAWQMVLGLWIYGRFWKGGHPPANVTAAVYLPAVGQNLVAGMSSAAFGCSELGVLFFGAGMFSWLALESMILGRAATHTPLPEAQRPLLGIQLAPAVVAGVCYTSLRPESADFFVQMLLGYGLYQAALALRLLPWIMQQRFAPSYWSFSFGVAALANLTLRLHERSPGTLTAVLAPLTLAGASLVVGGLLLGTVRLAWQGRLLPAAVV